MIADKDRMEIDALLFELADFVGKRGAFRRWVCVNCGRVNRKMRAS